MSGTSTLNVKIWFDGYVNALADGMPDTAYYNLPSRQTVEGIHQTYCEGLWQGELVNIIPYHSHGLGGCGRANLVNWSFLRFASEKE